MAHDSSRQQGLPHQQAPATTHDDHEPETAEHGPPSDHVRDIRGLQGSPCTAMLCLKNVLHMSSARSTRTRHAACSCRRHFALMSKRWKYCDSAAKTVAVRIWTAGTAPNTYRDKTLCWSVAPSSSGTCVCVHSSLCTEARAHIDRDSVGSANGHSCRRNLGLVSNLF